MVHEVVEIIEGPMTRFRQLGWSGDEDEQCMLEYILMAVFNETKMLALNLA